MQPLSQLEKFAKGALAREKWAKHIPVSTLQLHASTFNDATGGHFMHIGNIVLDQSPKRSSVITVAPVDKALWKAEHEIIYLFVRDGYIVKIGGTRNGMKKRWTSYLCGHHVQERGKSGKMSVTNAYLYHTIEKDLLETENKWSLWTWQLPAVTHTTRILHEDVTFSVQTFHKYESVMINKYKQMTGSIPFLCDNCDPSLPSSASAHTIK